MKKCLLILTLVAWLLSAGVMPVNAATYRFQVVSSAVNIRINSDGTAGVEYTFDFLNDPSASPIDAVDIGVPTSSYAMSSISADVDGKAVTDISDSPYVNPGVALNLGSLAIPPGQKGRVHVLIGKVSQILHPGTQKDAEAYASFQFSPTWFDSQYVSGSTNLSVTLTLPPGVKTAEPRYFPPQNWPGKSAPLTGTDSQGRAFYQWQAAQANSSTQYIFGAAFPARLVPARYRGRAYFDHRKQDHGEDAVRGLLHQHGCFNCGQAALDPMPLHGYFWGQVLQPALAVGEKTGPCRPTHHPKKYEEPGRAAEIIDKGVEKITQP